MLSELFHWSRYTWPIMFWQNFTSDTGATIQRIVYVWSWCKSWRCRCNWSSLISDYNLLRIRLVLLLCYLRCTSTETRTFGSLLKYLASGSALMIRFSSFAPAYWLMRFPMYLSYYHSAVSEIVEWCTCAVRTMWNTDFATRPLNHQVHCMDGAPFMWVLNFHVDISCFE